MHLLKEIEKMIKVPAYKNKALIVLNRVLLRRYPQVEDSKTITMEEIIDWNLWPNIFKMLGKYFIYTVLYRCMNIDVYTLLIAYHCLLLLQSRLVHAILVYLMSFRQ